MPVHPYGGAPTIPTPVTPGTPQAGMQSIIQGTEQAAEPDLKNKAGGAHKILSGAMDVAAPTIGAALPAAPIETVAGLVAGGLAQKGTEAGLKKAGVPDEYAELAGDVAGLGTGIAGGHLAGKLKPQAPVSPDQVLGPERATLDRQIPQTPAAKPEPQTIDLKPEDYVSGETTAAKPDIFDQVSPDKKTKGATNDDRNTVSVDDGQQPQGQAGSEEGQRSAGQPAAGSGQPEAEADPEKTRGPVAYGHDVAVNVPGEQTSYPARYAVREMEDIQPSHNPFSFERNPDYEFENDRDYSNPQNAARVVEYASKGNFKPDYTLTPSPTAEQGPTVVDARGNALGGNNRAMTLNRVYQSNPEGASAYRQKLIDQAQQFGLDAAEVQKFKRPVLTRELTTPLSREQSQKAITDFNKTAAAKLAPEEQAVADGRRISPGTLQAITGNLADVGEGSTLAQALKGDQGTDILQRLVRDGVLTDQEKNGYLDDKGQLTGGAKDRIAKALVGRMFQTPGDYAETAPSIRNKLERIAPHVLRVEDRPEWAVTPQVREAIGALADAKAHGIQNLDDLNQQTVIGDARTKQPYSADAIAIAKKLQEGPNKAAAAFRQYAMDSELSRDGSQNSFFEPPTQREAFDAAFGEPVPAMAMSLASDPVHQAYRSITGGKYNERVLLKDLRPKLAEAGLSRGAQDQALMDHIRAGTADVYPEDDPMSRTREDEEAALQLAPGIKRHLLYMRRPEPQAQFSLAAKRKAPPQMKVSNGVANAGDQVKWTGKADGLERQGRFTGVEDGEARIELGGDKVVWLPAERLSLAKPRAASAEEQALAFAKADLDVTIRELQKKFGLSVRDANRIRKQAEQEVRLPRRPEPVAQPPQNKILVPDDGRDTRYALREGRYKAASLDIPKRQYGRLAQKLRWQDPFDEDGSLPRPQYSLRPPKAIRIPDAQDEAPTHSYERNAPYGYHERRAAIKQIELPEEDAAHADAYAVNPHAMEAIVRNSGYNFPPDKGGLQVNGLHLGPRDARLLADSLELKRAGKPGGTEALEKAARRASEASKSLVLVRTNSYGRDVVNEQIALREELDHTLQRVASGESGNGEHLGDRAKDLLKTPLGARAAATLLRNGYRGTTGQIAAEVGVRLMVAGRERELGLSPQDANALGRNYVKHLEESYGQKAAERISERVQSANSARASGRARKSDGLPEGVRDRRRGSSQSGTGKNTQSGPDKSIAPAQASHDVRAGSRLTDGESGNLFSDDELRASEKAGNADKARLEGDRLSKQFDSPLTREEQVKKLRKPKSAQTDLFGDSKGPEQGALFSLKGKLKNRKSAQTELFDDGLPKDDPKAEHLDGTAKPVRSHGSAPLFPGNAEPDEEGKYNYSGLGALEDKLVRNLSQLKRASEPAHLAAIRSASSKSQAAVILKTAMPQIERALNGVTSPENFRRALVQSRLTGIQQRWQAMSNFAERASEANLTRSMDRLVPVLENLADKNGFPRKLADTAAALAEHSDYPNLRRLLVGSFGDAAKSVKQIMPADEFNALKHSPDFQNALRVYKSLVEQPMAKSHAQNEGIFSDALGPLDTYYPLIPIRDGDAVKARIGSKPEYSRPRNIANQFATGLSEDYDTSMEELRRRLTAAIKSNNKAALMDTLQDAHLVKKLEPWAPVPDTIEYQGQAYQAVAMETTPARQIIEKGKTTNLPPNRVLVPKWLEKELAPVLQNRAKPEPPGVARQIIHKINTVAISGPSDAVFHSSNLFGSLVANTPFLGKSLLEKAASAPILKRFAAIVKVASTDPTTEESARDLQEMSRLGILPDRFGSETYSRKYAEQTGAELKRFSMGPFLYGPKGVDVRARLVMYRIAKELNPKASGGELHAFVNQLGTYVDALHSEVERAAKHFGLAPFFTGSSTALRNGVNAWTGRGPMPSDNFSHWIWQQLTGGGVATVALWALAYKAYTGKSPWNDKRAKLLQIPANEEDRHSKIGQALWGKGRETGYINFTFFNPIVGRGARALGIKGAADSAMQGGKWWQMVEAAQKDMMNSAAHPFLGPIPRAAFVGLTGDEPYLTGLRDDRARLAPQLMPSVKSTSGAGSLAGRAAGAAKELNSFYGNVSAALGLGEQDPHSTANKWARMAADLALPGLVGNAQNPYAQSARITRQAAMANRRRR